MDTQDFDSNYKTDWFKFRIDLHKKILTIPNEWSADSLDRETERITNTIMDLYKKNSKPIKMKQNPKEKKITE